MHLFVTEMCTCTHSLTKWCTAGYGIWDWCIMGFAQQVYCTTVQSRSIGTWHFTGHDDVIKWKHFPRYWPFVRGIHRWPVNSPHKWPVTRSFDVPLICASINGWVTNRDAGDLRRHRTHYDVIVMEYSGSDEDGSRYRQWCPASNIDVTLGPMRLNPLSPVLDSNEETGPIQGSGQGDPK